MSSRRLDVDAFLARFDAMDRQLVGKGFHATSRWWRSEFERFLRSGKRRWVIRAGRRAGKSSFLCRLAVAWALWGPWSVPSGDVAVIPFVSIDRDEAASRIRTVKDILAALGIVADVRAEEIEMTARRCIFRVETCSIRSVGFTAVMVVADEMARWESRDSAANPAKDVMGSIRPTMATQELAFEICSSSPWGEDDYHAELVEQGTNKHQVVSQATTWEANPTISEERTHELEPDEKVWSREYANVPGGTVSQAFDRDDLLRALSGSMPTPAEWIVNSAGGFTAAELRGMTMQDVVDAISDVRKAEHVRHVFSDQRESASLESMFNARGLQFTAFAWTDVSKDECFQLLRRLLHDRDIWIIDEPTLRKELLGIKAHLLPSGRTRYPTNGLDLASAVVTLVHAIKADSINVGERFACIDPSSLRGDDFSLITGFRNGSRPLPEEPLRLEPMSRWDCYESERGFG